jgi:hypothetical protein
VNLICGFRREREKARAATATEVVARGSASSSRNCKTLSTDVACAGGPVRSSDETPVMGAERRGRTIQAAHVANRDDREELHG